jgi:hypothetical protein
MLLIIVLRPYLLRNVWKLLTFLRVITRAIVVLRPLRDSLVVQADWNPLFSVIFSKASVEKGRSAVPAEIPSVQ